MRILVLNQYFHPDLSATAQLLTQVTEDLAKHHDVYVVTGGAPKGRLLSRERVGDVRVLRVWSTSFPKRSMAGRIINYLTFLSCAVVGSLRVPSPDVVVAQTDPPPIGVVAASVAAIRRRPFVWIVKDIVPESVMAAGELGNPLMIRVLRWSRRFAARRAVAVGSIGNDMTSRLVSLGVPAEKIELVRDWADGRAVQPTETSLAFRQGQGWNDLFVVMHSGNMGMGAELDTVLDAAALLRDDPDILIVLVGDGINRPALEKRVAAEDLSNVRFLPLQPTELLATSLGAADTQLVAHRIGMEGFQVPSKIYGMLAAGKPCIALMVRDSDVSRIIEEARCGVTVQPGDPDALAEAIREVRSGDPMQLGVNARAAFEERYDRPMATAAYLRMLEAAARSR